MIFSAKRWYEWSLDKESYDNTRFVQLLEKIELDGLEVYGMGNDLYVITPVLDCRLRVHVLKEWCEEREENEMV